MERLTKTVNGVVTYIGTGSEFDTGMLTAELSSGQIRAVMNRLAAYEGTGLYPEDLKKAFNETAILKLAAQALSTTPDHLRDLLQAEQDEQLVVLPCKVGDTVYVIGESCDFCETYLDEPERCMRCEKGHYVEERGFELWMLSELNESIFLTREEAEAALKGGHEA